jgi:Flp pilus assembly protein TadG
MEALMRRFNLRSERGAAAVEFAIVIPLLLLLLIGIAEFGRVFYMQNSITNAARVAARTMAVEASTATTAAAIATAVSDAKNAAVDASVVSPAVTTAQVAISPGSCVPPASGQAVYVTVTITYPVQQMTGFLPAFPTSLTGKGSMRCDG